MDANTNNICDLVASLWVPFRCKPQIVSAIWRPPWGCLWMPNRNSICDLAASLWVPFGCKTRIVSAIWRPPWGAFWMQNTNSIWDLAASLWVPLGALILLSGEVGGQMLQSWVPETRPENVSSAVDFAARRAFFVKFWTRPHPEPILLSGDLGLTLSVLFRPNPSKRE